MTPVLARRLGNDRAFERLYRKHAGDVYRYALVVLRNQADAEDVTQTTFLNAYRAIERGERPQKPQNWLIAIAHNVCRQRFRQSQRRPSEVAYEDELAEAVVDEDGVTAEDIRRALGHLAFSQRSALVMRELEGRSYQEIAEILGTTVSAVETLLFRARRALREQLEEGITCHEAELAISRQLDGRLSRGEKGALRAHLRECSDCSAFARSQRAQRGALRSLGAIPLPSSLVGLFGGGGGAATGGVALSGAVAVKAAAFAAGAILVSGAGYEGVKQELLQKPPPVAAAVVAAPKAHVHVSRPAAAATLTPTQEARDDQKPYRPAGVKAHRQRRAHRGRAVVPVPARHAAASPAKERAHDLKPFKPQHPATPAKSQGHHVTPKRNPKPKPVKVHKQQPTPGSGNATHGKGSGATGSNGHARGQTPDVAETDAHGKSGH
jgi:RNA polymerase sigma factor (sigma-70 family)